MAVYEDGSILAPCGRCREFISQVDDESFHATVLLPNMNSATLKQLLPE